MAIKVKVGIHETGEVFDCRKDLAKELGIADAILQNFLYNKKPWNGLNFYIVQPDRTHCISCEHLLTKENYPKFVQKQGWRLCADCYRKRGRERLKRLRKVNPFTYKALSWRSTYNCSITKLDLEKLWETQGPCCKLCNKSITKEKSQLDHIEPVSKGGKSEPSNLQFLCEKCNRGKFNWSTEVYIEHCKKVTAAN